MTCMSNTYWSGVVMCRTSDTIFSKHPCHTVSNFQLWRSSWRALLINRNRTTSFLSGDVMPSPKTVYWIGYEIQRWYASQNRVGCEPSSAWRISWTYWSTPAFSLVTAWYVPRKYSLRVLVYSKLYNPTMLNLADCGFMIPLSCSSQVPE